MSNHRTCARCFAHFEEQFLVSHGECVDNVWYCFNCARAVRNEKAKEEKANRELERVIERAQERDQREKERKRQEELDATLDWYPCSHCGSSIREDNCCHKFHGEWICSECWKRLVKCNSCGKKFICDDLAKYPVAYDYARGRPVYMEDRRKVYKKINGVITFDYLDTCPDCMPAVRKKNAVWFNDQKQAERQAIYEKNQQKAAMSSQQKEASLVFLPVLCVILALIEFFVFDCSWKILGISELILIVAGFIFRTIFGWIGRIAAIALFLEIAFGLIISVVCWFAIDAFVNPLIICGASFLLLSSILEITGVSRKYLDNDTIKELLRLS